MRFAALFLVLFIACQPAKKKACDFAAFVNPFVGTGGDMSNGFGNMFPGAAYPFGMIQLSPDNGGQGWQYAAGYHYPDSMIVGFSHTHLSGTGVADFCDISVMPTVQPIAEKYFVQADSTVKDIISEKSLDPNKFINRDGQPGPFDKHFLLEYSSKFSHKTEKASPGFYSVNLTDDNIDVDLTTTEFAGMHRYRFNKSSDRQSVVLNLGFTNSDRTTDALVRYRSSELITGYRFSTGKANVQRVYFAMQFSRKIKECSYFLADSTDGKQLAKGKNVAAAFSFDSKENQELLLKVAISSVSEEGALANLKTSDRLGWNFDQMHQETRAKWNAELSKSKR